MRDTTDQDFALVIYNGTTCAARHDHDAAREPGGVPGLAGDVHRRRHRAPASTYQWRKNGSNIARRDGDVLLDPIGRERRRGQLRRRRDERVQRHERVAALTVIDRSGHHGPARRRSRRVLGTSKTSRVTATGTAPLTYQWRKDAVNIAGATASSYVDRLRRGRATPGRYDVVVTNACGSATSSGRGV